MNNKSNNIKIEGSIDDVIRLAYGGTIDKANGGTVQGPTHEQGGVPVVDNNTGEEIAEVEGNGVGVDGGERIFSTEDTQQLEEAATQIIQLMDSGDQKKAEDLAMRLGFAVVNMIAEQEKSQASQENDMNEAMNSFDYEGQG